MDHRFALTLVARWRGAARRLDYSKILRGEIPGGYTTVVSCLSEQRYDEES